jgi:hypothetical protein
MEKMMVKRESKWLVCEELDGKGTVAEWFEKEDSREEPREFENVSARECMIRLFVVDKWWNVVVGTCGMCGKEEKVCYRSTVRVTEEDGTVRYEHNVRGANRAKDAVVKQLDKNHAKCR